MIYTYEIQCDGAYAIASYYSMYVLLEDLTIRDTRIRTGESAELVTVSGQFGDADIFSITRSPLQTITEDVREAINAAMH